MPRPYTAAILRFFHSVGLTNLSQQEVDAWIALHDKRFKAMHEEPCEFCGDMTTVPSMFNIPSRQLCCYRCYHDGITLGLWPDEYEAEEEEIDS